jgi:hypothetical protein
MSQPAADRHMIFIPGFGAGAVAGYAVVRIDSRIVPANPHEPALPPATTVHGASEGSLIEDVQAAFADWTVVRSERQSA